MEREKEKNVNQVEKEGRTKERKVEEKNVHQKRDDEVRKKKRND